MMFMYVPHPTQALAEAQGSAPAMAALLRRLDQHQQPPQPQQQPAPSTASDPLRWVGEALQEFLAVPQAFK